MVRTRRPTRKGCLNHPIDLKRSLAAAACVPEVSVAKLALEHGVNTNLLFKWRREYRKGKFGTPDPAHVGVSTIAESAVVPTRHEVGVTLLPVQVPELADNSLALSPCIEVVFSAVTVRITGSPTTAVLRTVLDTLVRRS